MAPLDQRPPPASDDGVIAFHIEDTDVRGQVVRLGDAIHEILSRHNYPDQIAQLLGEALVLTAMLGASMKFDGKLILQMQGDGAVTMLITNYETDGAMRGYVKLDETRLSEILDTEDTAQRSGGYPPLPALFGKGFLAMTVDQGIHTDRYQGIVELKGDRVADCALTYFAQSEQILTNLKLAVAQLMAPGAEPRWRAGGLLLQLLPPTGEHQPATHASLDDWERASVLADTTEDHELLDPGITSETLLHRLFHEDGVRAFTPKPVNFACSCKREKIEQILTRFPAEDRMDMLEDGVIRVRCEFCNTQYDFDPGGLEQKS